MSSRTTTHPLALVMTSLLLVLMASAAPTASALADSVSGKGFSEVPGHLLAATLNILGAALSCSSLQQRDRVAAAFHLAVA
mmetsp:Transcript_58295/g.125239  ORF Transcript_58295/g.125239 Transcript_58295/m.125239 type:complete len:81 (-) Transcript_58295:213-455(-)